MKSSDIRSDLKNSFSIPLSNSKDIGPFSAAGQMMKNKNLTGFIHQEPKSF
jgi:hypothetical protein